jgi:hypothetical protein
VAVAACSAPPAPLPATPEIRIVQSTLEIGVSAVEVVGLPVGDLAALRDGLDAEAWRALLHVTSVTPGDHGKLPAAAGIYEVAGSVLRFIPEFPLDPRVAHQAVFNPRRLPDRDNPRGELWRAQPLTRYVAGVVVAVAPSTRVVQMFPPEVLLENQLRVYLQFSAPMGRRPARDYVRLLDDAGQEVVDAFLPLGVSLWNATRTRCTLLFDPGRVKRGILPNAEMGRPLTAGRRYIVVVSREWRDSEDRPLVEEFRREIRVVPAVMTAIEPEQWRLALPVVGGRSQLTVVFPRALDRALAERSFTVSGPDSQPMNGTVGLDSAATQWTFTPDAAWEAGAHQLTALSILEDPAGNRVWRAFDSDPTQKGSVTGAAVDVKTRTVVPFMVAPAP